MVPNFSLRLVMDDVNLKLASFPSKTGCNMSDPVFLPSTNFSKGAVSLIQQQN